MHNTGRSTVFVAVIASATLLMPEALASPPAGLQLYTPTRIEWACLQLNELAKVAWEGSSQYGLLFSYDGADPNTVVIQVIYEPEMDRVRLNKRIENARMLALRYAKVRGWDWLKVKERVEMWNANSTESQSAPPK